MTDRGLLDAAAKAAGIKLDWRESVQCLCYAGSPYNIAWNPLADHGEAARLAMALRMRLDVTDDYVSAEVEALAPRHFAEPINGDACKAWCRAIVRAAAAMAA